MRKRSRIISCASDGHRSAMNLGQLIAIRVDAGVLDQFRREALRRRAGYQTLINEVLARHVRKCRVGLMHPKAPTHPTAPESRRRET